jgi:hypothetical protein
MECCFPEDERLTSTISSPSITSSLVTSSNSSSPSIPSSSSSSVTITGIDMLIRYSESVTPETSAIRICTCYNVSESSPVLPSRYYHNSPLKSNHSLSQLNSSMITLYASSAKMKNAYNMITKHL